MASIKKIEGQRGTSYKITVSAGYDFKGKKIRKTATFTPDPQKTYLQNQAALKDFAYEFEKAVKTGQYYDGESITLAQFGKKWFKDYAEQQLEPKTVTSYRHCYESYILPYLGHLKIAQIRPMQIIELWIKLQTENVRKDGKPGGLGAATIHRCHAVLSKIFTCAQQWQVVPENPCRNVSTPPNSKSERDNYFTPEQAIIFLEMLDRGYNVTYSPRTRKDSNGNEYTVSGYQERKHVPLQYKVFYNIALFGGLRCGELLGLTWDCINFDQNTISVTRSISYTNHVTYVKTTKTKASQRIITLPDSVMALISQLWEEQKNTAKNLGTYWNNPDGNLFTQDNGARMFYSTPYSKFKALLKHHNEFVKNSNDLTEDEKESLLLPDITLHGLRHTSATLLIAQNLDVRTVSARLGHAQTSTTMNIYAHALKAQDEKASTALENILKPNTKEPISI